MPAAGRVCGQDRGPASCAGPVWARGLCRRHYRQQARGGVVDAGERAVGAPSGHGQWGIVDVDEGDGGRLVCHDCGRTFIALAVHIGMVHDDVHPGGVREYRLRHGLPMSVSLIARDLAARLAEAARPAASRLAAVRSPDTLGAPQEMVTRGLRLSRRVGRPRPDRYPAMPRIGPEALRPVPDGGPVTLHPRESPDHVY